MIHTSFNTSGTLSRAATPNSTLGSANWPTPSPKCFGRNTHMLKEEYERERVRWQQKLEEVEQKLTEASINNSELFQIKAELNRKIIDFEKNQRPMIEQNRRLNERIRALNTEVKELEKKLAFAQDDFLSLRDAYDRLIKENSVLKEQRAFPEKLEELGRYRNQVLEYSKCITALRQSAVEKDRRYEMIVQKFRKYRKLLSSRRPSGDASASTTSSSSATTTLSAVDDDRHSYIGSEGSMDSSLMCLDTITEDLDENMEFSADLLQSPMTTVEFGLKQQLELANMTIIELQNTLDSSNRISPNAGARLQEQIRQLQASKRQLEAELANAQHNNELLEFQLTELTEGLQHSERSCFSDKQCGTDVQLPPTAGEFTDIDFTICKRVNVNAEEATATSDALLKVLHIYAPVLQRDDFETMRKVIEITDALQNKVTFAETELNMLNCELSRLQRFSKEEIDELRRQADDNTTRKQQRKKELQAEIDQLKKEKKDDIKKNAKQVAQLEDHFQQKTKEIAEKTDQIRHLNGEIRVMSTKLENQNATIAANAKTIEELRAQFESLLTELTAAKSDLKAMRNSSFEENEKLNKTLEHGCLDSTAELEMLRSENARLRVDLETRLGKSREKVDTERAEMNAQRRALERELSDARVKIQTLKEQIRPIGSQLERRYEESRYRLSEALKKIHELEQRLEAGNVSDKLANDDKEYAQMRMRCAQTEVYNRELQEQFNAQLELMNVLKKEIITLKGKKSTQSTDSIGWTSNSGSDSMDDEQYHSEESADTAIGRRAASVSEKTSATPISVTMTIPITRH